MVAIVVALSLSALGTGIDGVVGEIESTISSAIPGSGGSGTTDPATTDPGNGNPGGNGNGNKPK